MASDTRRLKVVVTGESGEAQKAVEAVGKSAEKSESSLGKFAARLKEWGTRGAIALGAIGVAAGAMGIKTAMGLEQAEVGFTTMLGSAEKAKKFIGELQKFAAATPFEFPELVGSAQQFLAMGFAAKDIIPMLTAVGDAVAAMGGSAENIDSVTRAIGQMQAKGHVAGDELMQLTEQGIPALQILADSYGVSTAQMSKMVEKGQVLSSKAIPLLIKGLEGGTKSVKGFGGMMEAQSQTMSGKWSTLMDNLQTGLANFVRNFEPQIKGAMDVAGKAIGDFFAGLQGKGALEGFSGTVNNIGLGLHAMVEAFKNGDVTSDGLVGKFEKLGATAKQVYDVLTDIASTTKDVVEWFGKHKTVTEALAIAMGTLLVVTEAHALVLNVQAAGGLAKWIAQIPIVTSLTKIWAAVQWALNGAVAFFTSPITLVVLGIIALIAIVVLAYKKVDWFRAFIDGTWRLIKQVTSAVVDWLVGTAWPGLKAFFEGVGTVAMWLYTNVIKPSFDNIRYVVMSVVNFFLSYVWPNIQTVFGAIGTALSLLYNGVWKPIWIVIQVAVAIFMAYFRNIVWPVLKWVFDALAGIVMLLWNNVFKPAWAGIQYVVKIFVDWFMNNVWPRLQTGFNLIKDIVAILWELIKDRFNKIKDKIGDFATSAIDAFNKAKEGIKKAWDLISNIAKVPVNFVIGTVYNKGILPLWNKVAGAFGVGTRLDPIKELADGGVLPGYAPKKDTIPAMLSPGEGILVPEAVKQLGARRILEWNQAARSGRSVQMYKDGGIVDWGKGLVDKGKNIIQGIAGSAVEPLVNGLRGILNGVPNQNGLGGVMRTGVNGLLDKFIAWVRGKDAAATAIGNAGNWPSSPGAQRGDSGVWRSIVALIKSTGPISGTFGNAYRPGDPLWHGSGRAVDWMGYNQDALASFLAAHNPLELIHRTSTRDYAYTRGKNKGSFNETLMNQHRNHVHIAMDNGGILPPDSDTLVRNATSEREFALTEDKLRGIAGIHIENVNITIDGSGGKDPKTLAREIRDELVKLGGRNGGKTGLPGK